MHKNVKKIVAALFVSAAFVGAPAFAQTAVAPVAPQAVDPAATAAVRELLDAMNYRSVMQQTMQQMVAALPAQMKAGAEAAIRNNPKFSDEERTKKLAEMEANLPKVTAAMASVFNDPTLIDEMIAEMVPLYARHFTPAEMREMAAFYKTPVGAKGLRLMPQLMGEGMQIGQKVMTPRLNKLMQELQK